MIHGWEKAHCQIGYVMRFPSLALVCIALFSTTDSASGQDVDVTLDQAVNNENRRNRHKKHRGARTARRQNWGTNAYNKVKPYAGPAAGMAQSAWGVHTNGRDLYNLAKGRKLIAANRDDERHGEVALVPPTQLRHHRKKSRGARKARRQNWVTNAYNKVKPY
ncbi:hypothetical protein AC1031_021627 [Aphanomyces cochlioides]|nr:hypothetical protein AC1031_021627 [Aphanomyces cochlioides]